MELKDCLTMKDLGDWFEAQPDVEHAEWSDVLAVYNASIVAQGPAMPRAATKKATEMAVFFVSSVLGVEIPKPVVATREPRRKRAVSDW